MNPSLNDAETALRERVRLTAVPIAAAADGIDQGVATTADVVGMLAAGGVLGVCIPKAHGGYGGGTVELALACEEIGAASASVGVVAVSHLVSGLLLDSLGSAAQKKEWLSGVATGTTLVALAFDCGGSVLDAPSVGVSGTPEAEGFRLDGKARAVAGSTLADLLIVPVEVESVVMLAVIEVDTDGISVGQEVRNLGLNGAGLAPVEFCGVEVPAASMLSGANVYTALTMAGDLARIGHAALTVGIGRAALEGCLGYVSGRKDALGREQSVQWMLADMATETEAARLLTWYAASRTNLEEIRETAPMARLLAADTAVRTSRRAVQVFGVIGIERRVGIERLYRDAKAMEIYHGAIEVQRLAVAGELLPGLVSATNGVR